MSTVGTRTQQSLILSTLTIDESSESAGANRSFSNKTDSITDVVGVWVKAEIFIEKAFSHHVHVIKQQFSLGT